jgi:hypothetical protein
LTPNDNFIDKIATLVSKKLQPPIATSNWQNYNLNPPNSSNLAVPNSTPALKFDNTIIKNDKNDIFDQKRLLKFVPVPFKQKAKQLLETIEKNPEQLTFSSDGVIYIDKTSIPNSDICHLFPYLYKQKHPKNLEGFDDFLNKINQMGLSHLTKQRNLKKPLQIGEGSKQGKSNWWYLGP